jgi:hypothetical protein
VSASPFEVDVDVDVEVEYAYNVEIRVSAPEQTLENQRSVGGSNSVRCCKGGSAMIR